LDDRPAAVRVSKQIASKSRGWPQGERWERQDALLLEVVQSPDARERAAALAEKCKPDRTGQ
jgi:enoyl-CoA hydratase